MNNRQRVVISVDEAVENIRIYSESVAKHPGLVVVCVKFCNIERS